MKFVVLAGYMLGRAAEVSQLTVAAIGIHQDPIASSSQQRTSDLLLLLCPESA